jgi:twitching motility two-component system response regulator PilG
MGNVLTEFTLARTILSEIQQAEYSGGLSVRAEDGREWVLYCQDGRLTFVAGGSRLLVQLAVQLKRHRLGIDVEGALARLKEAAVPEHALIGLLLARKLLNRFHAFEVTASLMRTALVELSEAGSVRWSWVPMSPLEPRLASVLPLAMLQEADALRLDWERLKPHIESPAEVLHVRSGEQLRERLPEQICNRLVALLDGERTLEAVAEAVAQEPLVLARALVPLIESGALGRGRPEPQADGPLVVCIDDSPTIGRMMERILRRAGMRALYIEKPLTALSQLFRERPGLVFLDLSMPEIDGYQLCKMIRRSPALKDVPVVMLTGREGLFDRARAGLVGASEYLTKPVQEAKVLAVLERHGLIARRSEGDACVENV